MDYALTKYGEAFVGDVKALFKVSEIQPNKIGGFYNSFCFVLLNFQVAVMFIPVTFFWACFDQQFTTWVFQATHMDGGIFGSDSRVAFPPAYMAILNSVFILIFIPLFNKVVYPGLGEAIFKTIPTNDFLA